MLTYDNKRNWSGKRHGTDNGGYRKTQKKRKRCIAAGEDQRLAAAAWPQLLWRLCAAGVRLFDELCRTGRDSVGIWHSLGISTCCTWKKHADDVGRMLACIAHAADMGIAAGMAHASVAAHADSGAANAVWCRHGEDDAVDGSFAAAGCGMGLL